MFFPMDSRKGLLHGGRCHTEMLSLNLTGSCGTIRAGQPYLASVAKSGTRLAPTLLANEQRFSFGEVASLDPAGVCNAFPADSFFNMFVEVEARGTRYYNLTPMIVRATITDFPPDLSLPQAEYIHDPRFPPIPLFDGNGCHVAFLKTSGHGSATPEPRTVPEALDLIDGPVTFGVDSISEGLEPGVQAMPPNHVWDDSHPPFPERLLTAYQSSGLVPGAAPDTTNARVPELVGSIEDPDVNPPRDFIPGDAINSFSFGQDGTVEPIFLVSKNGNLFFSVARGSGGSGGGTAVGVANNLQDEAGSIFASSVDPFGAYAGRVTIPLPGTTTCPAGETNFLVQGSLALGLRGGLCNDLGGQDNVIALEIDDYDATSDRYYLTLIGDAAILHNDCNGNGFPDSCEIDIGVVLDGNGNGVPDECENDCNGNGIADECDISCGAPMGSCDVPGCGGSSDGNANGVPDVCEPDCNGNGIRDADDIAGATSGDGNSNGIPDECERTSAIFIYANQSDPGPYRYCDLAVFAPAGAIGLGNLDVIDALVLSDLTPGMSASPNGVLDTGLDEALFSLAPGSPTLGALGASAADIFYTDFAGTFSLFASATNLGVLDVANVDAIDIGPAEKGACWDPDAVEPDDPRCFEVTRQQCKEAQWLYAGDGTECLGGGVPPVGICCLRTILSLRIMHSPRQDNPFPSYHAFP